MPKISERVAVDARTDYVKFAVLAVNRTRTGGNNVCLDGFSVHGSTGDQAGSRTGGQGQSLVGSQSGGEAGGISSNARANELGNQCYTLIRANRLQEAKQACELGLALKPSDGWIRAALLYNVGLIAEKSGDCLGAQTHYQESLRIRPPGRGSATVEQALAKLGGCSR